MKLCLGTVQFGMDYGIAGRKRPALQDAVEMLDFATQNGISHIDTAYAYGCAEDVVGAFLRRKTVPRDGLFISAKLKPNIMDGVGVDRIYDTARANIEESLARLGTDYVDAYMCHSARYIYDDAILEAMVRLRDAGLARHVGVSVYEVDEARKCISDKRLDFMQLPFSILDQRMRWEGVFEMDASGRMTIDARSAFVQGLVLMAAGEVPDFLARARPFVEKVDLLCRRHGLSRVAMALGFVKRQRGIGHLVFGVDSLSQLKEDIAAFNETDLAPEVVKDVDEEFQGVPADVVMPSLWARK